MTDILTYHVLALSGGGYRSLYTAAVLAELETALGRPIASYFDLICGTSAGGMLALGLAAEIPAQELKALFENEGSLDRGFGKWRGGLFGLVISAQESSVDYMLRQSLGANYYQIDDKATPDQSKDVKALDRVSIGATNTLKDRGNHAAQRALGDPLFQPFRVHQAGTPPFYHGPNKNVLEATC